MVIKFFLLFLENLGGKKKKKTVFFSYPKLEKKLLFNKKNQDFSCKIALFYLIRRNLFQKVEIIH